MPASTVYCKTRAGHEELARRNHHLKARTRSLLILIDGHSSWAELSARLQLGAEAEDELRELLDAALICPLDALGPPTES